MQFDEFLLTPWRVAVHVPSSTAIAADLHLGYQQARRNSGDAVPLLTLEETLAGLDLAIEKCALKQLVIAGDLFERGFCPAIWSEFTTWLANRRVTLVALVPGNHDRGLDGLPAGVPVFPGGFEIGSWLVLHGDQPLPPRPVILGHFHPGVVYRGRKAPCYLASPTSLVLPAFSQDAAAGNVRGQPRWRAHRCFAIAAGKVIQVFANH